VKRIALGIQYDGRQWQGWQTQPHRKTVQDTLEAALAKFCQQSVATVCAGRTDSGVHAIEQVVHFDTEAERELFAWVRGLNAFLPATVAVRWAAEVAGGTQTSGAEQDAFHARFSAQARTYHYLIYNHPVRSPLWSGRSGWVFRPLRVEAMQAAAQALIGTHDFSAFRAAECRTMHTITLQRQGELILVTLKANAFLHHMVRNIVGSLIQVGIGNAAEAWVGEVLAARNRDLAAPTFSPDGLYLAKIDYDARWNLPQIDTTTPLFWNHNG